MSESDASRNLMKALAPLHPKRIENLLEPGIPDINYADGWIETKWAEKWPDKGGRLKLAHYTPDQRIFQLKRGRAGGRIHLMLNVGQEWFLLGWEFAFGTFYTRGCTRAESLVGCEKYWLNGLNAKELVEYLK